MADQLASPGDLAALLGRDDLDLYKVTMLVECATAVVQAAAGQRIVQVVGDTAELVAGSGQWLSLPEYPVQSVASVDYNGTALAVGTDGYRVRGSRLYRRCGWLPCPGDLVPVTVVYTHGYPDGDQALQLGRSAVIGLIRGVYDNPEGLKAASVDDWSATYAVLSTQMEATPTLRAALRRQYGRRR